MTILNAAVKIAFKEFLNKTSEEGLLSDTKSSPSIELVFTAGYAEGYSAAVEDCKRALESTFGSARKKEDEL